MQFIDVHSHLQDKAYDADRDEVITRTKAAGIETIIVGTDRQMSEDAVVLAERTGFWATIGQHPTDKHEEIFEYDFYKNLALRESVVGIGECGIDYFRVEGTGERVEKEKQRQKELFEQQIKLAVEIAKPLMIHGRPTQGTQNAYDDILDLLHPHSSTLPSNPGNVHFFAGNWETAQKFLKLGFTLSFTGVITFTNDYDEVIKNTPLDRLLTETDAPYVAPVPHRGKRNEPIFVIEVVNRIAELKQESVEKVTEQVAINAKRVFGI